MFTKEFTLKEIDDMELHFTEVRAIAGILHSMGVADTSVESEGVKYLADKLTDISHGLWGAWKEGTHI